MEDHRMRSNKKGKYYYFTAGILILFIGLMSMPTLLLSDVTSITTTGPWDGRIYETNAGSKVGYFLKLNNTRIQVGDEDTGREFRIILGYDISSLSDSITITSATLFVFFDDYQSANINSFTPIYIDNIDFGIAMDPTNFQMLCKSWESNCNNDPFTAADLTNYANDTFINKDVTAAVISNYNNSKDPVQFRFRSSNVNNDGNDDWMRIYTYNKTNSNGDNIYGSYIKIHHTAPPPASNSVTNLTQGTGHPSITSALSSANNGDVIEAGYEVYNETVYIKNFTSLTLRSVMWQSNGNTNTIITGGGARANALVISNSSYIHIEGFTIKNSDKDVVLLDLDTAYCTIAHCNIESSLNESGIFLNNDDSISNNIIISNNIYDNDAHGVWCRGGNNNKIIGNILKNNGNAGIRQSGSGTDYLLIFNNRIISNRRGIRLKSGNDATIDNNYIALHEREGILVEKNSDNIVITNNVICSNTFNGILFDNEDNETVNNCRIRMNQIFANQTNGIKIIGGDNNRIDYNNIYSNSLNGISINSNAVDNIITKNNIIDNTAMNFLNQTGIPIQATNNWWGTTVAPDIALKISGNGNYLNFSPYRLFGPFDLSLNADTVSMPAITSIRTTVVDETNITLTWAKPADTIDFARYFVYKSSNRGYTNLTQAYVIWQTNNEDATNYNEIIPAGKKYYYYVTSLDNYSPYTNESWYSPKATSLAYTNSPSAPTNLSAVTNGLTIQIAWADVSFETSYTLFRSSSIDTNSAGVIAGLAADTLTHLDATVSPGTNYYYWVKAYNEYGGSGFSAAISNKVNPKVYNRTKGTGHWTITNAVNSANNGDLIEVAPGVYHEMVIIQNLTSLTLRSIMWTNSNNNTTTIIEGDGARDNCLWISNSANIRIEGFTMTNSDKEVILIEADTAFSYIGHCNIAGSEKREGIFVENADSISNLAFISNKIYNNDQHGIYYRGADNSSIIGNIIENNTGDGIYQKSINTDGLLILSNKIINNRYGIRFDNGDDSTIDNNYIALNSQEGIYVENGSDTLVITNNVICSNSSHGILFDDDQNDSSRIRMNRIFANQSNGIQIIYGDDNIIDNNNIIFNNIAGGISLIAVSNTIISNNNIYNNNDYGILILSILNNDAVNNIVSHNEIFNNKEGIYLSSMGNSKVNTTYIVGNNVTNNTGTGILLNNVNGNNDRTTVTNNYIADNDFGGIIIFGSRKNIFNNIVYSNRGVGITVNNGRNNSIQENTVYASRAPYGAGIVVVNGKNNNVILGNIYNNIGPGILIAGASTNNKIELNSIYSNGGHGIIVSNNCRLKRNRARRNNIFHNTGDNFNNQSGTNINIENNWWDTTVASEIASKISGNGGYSNFTPYRLFGEYDITPGADISSLPRIPFLGTLVTNQTNITFTWLTPTTSTGFARYFLYESPIPGYTNLTGTNVIWQINDFNTTTHQITIPPGVTNYYFMTCLDTNSPYTNECFYSIQASSLGTTPPSTPTNILATPNIDGMFVTWANASNETSYTLFRNTVNDTNTNTFTKIGYSGPTTRSYLDTTVEYDTVYYYWVKAYNMVGESGLAGAASNMVITRPELSHQVVTNNRIILTWSSVGSASGYFISNSMGTNGLIGQAGPAVTTITDMNTYTNGATFSYYIFATNQWGRSIVRLNNVKIAAPDAPNWVSAVAAETSIDLKWEFMPITTGYTLYRNTENSISNATMTTQLAFNITNYTDTGLTPDTKYYYWLRVNNGLGSSEAVTNAFTLKSTDFAFADDLSGVRIAPTTIFGMNKQLYFEKITEDTEVAIYDIKGRKLWSKKAAECRKTPDQNYYYVDETVINSLVDGLYIIVFTDSSNEPIVKKFNRISRERK